MKILVTSDNHLGFKETDPIRADDTFNTFEEILSLARAEKADIVLQGGDLFHENKPSRNTYNRTVQILKKYCLGAAAPSFTSSIRMNTEDPNMSVSLPILSIHGNHDDPSGFNSVSPHDILHSTGLVNYIGKVEDVDDIRVVPVLIYGERKVAIYGIGHIKDRRMHSTFLAGKVRYARPPGDDWVSILVVHQNRVFRKDEYLPEDLIDPFIDVVIYGHEHESLKLQHRNFDVIQCGSTVRTSLCDGEMGDKFSYIIDVKETVSIRRVRLETVRPFVMDSVKVADGNADQAIRGKIEGLLERAREGSGNGLKPLVRLRVELGASQGFNKHLVASLLKGKIANPEDAVRVTRRSQKEVLRREAAVQKADVEDIYKGILDVCELKVLVQGRVVEALNEFVNKDMKEAFSSLVRDGVERIVNGVSLDDLTVEGIEDAIGHAREKARQASALDRSEVPEEPLLAVEVPMQSDSTHSFPTSLDNVNSSVLQPPTSSNYTFIEDKLESIERQDIVRNVRKELEDMERQKVDDIKRQKEEDMRKQEADQEVDQEVDDGIRQKMEDIKRQKVDDDLDDLFGFDKFISET